ncbi:AdoMet-dependent rRNA methyltransferase [Nymphaea thermarum]|nr:AdoMet-dependent rRNA methyltransferase [Nymphaea thermarum]
MGKAKGKHRLDKYYYQAKELGYRSRAAFKIVQLDAKFRFLSSARSLLDLCAAPGSWMQVAVKHMPVGSFVLGVDLFPIKPMRGAISIEADITTSKCRSEIRKRLSESGRNMFDVVLHDGSPNVGGAWAQEATSQAALVVDAVKLAVDFLAPKGTFVTKVFRSQDYNAILYCMKQLFEKVEVTKPDASRSSSAEIYVIGLKYKAPAKIDPRLLDMKYLFQGALERPKVVDVLRGTKQKRNREGYEDGDTTLRKVCLASDFVWSETPLEILGSVTSISFDDSACAPIKDHDLTTEEIKVLCDDLRVLGKHDFKQLLKWRMNVRKALSPKKEIVPKPADGNDGNKLDDDDRMLNEMEELTRIMERKKKRAKKLLVKRRAKVKARKATGIQLDDIADDYTDMELFSLSSIKGKKGLQAVDSTDVDVEVGDRRESESEDDHAAPDNDHSSSDLDSEQERERYDKMLEGCLDQLYDSFVSKTEGKAKKRRRRREALASSNDELWKAGEDNVGTDDDFDQEDEDGEANPLMVPLYEEPKPIQEEITEQWFSQDVFSTVPKENHTSDESEDELGDKMPLGPPAIEKLDAPDAPPLIQPDPVGSKVVQEDDFEIVPAERSDSSDDSSSDDESGYDTDSKAEILAYAKKMLRKKQREQILDDAYGRYMFDDEGLPSWFVEEEKKHCQPIKPVTKEEIAAMKARFREIDARPSKKVAEAKARKKKAAMRQLEKARRKASSISDQTDIPERSKRKMIDKLYKTAMPKKPEKKYVVAKKGVQVKSGKGTVVVDRRMKKDKRSRGGGRPGKKGKGKKMKPAKGPNGKGAGRGSVMKRNRASKRQKMSTND